MAGCWQGSKARGRQLLKAGTSIGANYHEANRCDQEK